MSDRARRPACEHIELASALALGSIPAEEALDVERHVASCQECQREVESLRPVVANLAQLPWDIERPQASLRERVARRISGEMGRDITLFPETRWREPEWEEVAPGIACKLLATDDTRHRVSMLVRLAPGVAYPPHSHAGIEELHLLDGELWIEDRKLEPGDYNRAEAGSSDSKVWTETGCTCVLITSSEDLLR